MSELKDMPVVTVEQVHRFREEALRQLSAEKAAREKAEAKLAELEKQEPIYEYREIGESGWIKCDKAFYDTASKEPELDTRIVYTSPLPAPDLQKRVDELNLQLEMLVTVCEAREHENAELTKKLAEREAGRREVVPEVTCDVIKDASRYRFIRNQLGQPTPEEFDKSVDADMLAATPKPEGDTK